MPKFVKDIFMVIFWVVLATVLYFMIFSTQTVGSWNLGWQGNEISGSTHKGLNTDADNNSQIPIGALWHIAHQLQVPMSEYYYKYVYLPSWYRDRYIDELLDMRTDVNPSTEWNDAIDTHVAPAGDGIAEGSVKGTAWSTGWQ